MKNPEKWTCEDVANWLEKNGFSDYVHLFTLEHKIDGEALLLLNESDLRTEPLSLNVLGDIKRLTFRISELKRHTTVNIPQTSQACYEGVTVRKEDSSGQNLHVCSTGEGKGTTRFAAAGDASSLDFSIRPSIGSFDGVDSEGEITRQRIRRLVESPDTKIKSLFKTLLAGLYCSSSLLITSFVMVIVHDRVPDMKTYPPLPDIFLDNVPLIPWAFQVCEVIACTMAIIWFTILFFHKSRFVLMRRMFSLTGTVFLLRCVTMLITSMSVPGIHLDCERTLSPTSLNVKLRQAFHIWSKMGMSIRGVTSCGDYMFSGHTVAVTLLNHFITEYTPDSWHYVHTTTWVLNLFGIFFILAAHEHYSLDVFVAFYISSRLFVYYHTMAYAALHLTQSDERTRMWFPLFWFFESGGHVGRVSNDYEWPFPSYSTILDKLSTVFAGGRKAILSRIESATNNRAKLAHSVEADLKKRRKKVNKAS